MKKIAVLGPKGTYCEDAALRFSKENPAVLKYYPSILKTAMAIDEDVDVVLPFENTLDGFVIESLDAIIQNRCFIQRQVKIPIAFAFVGNATSIKEIQKVYVQFKAFGQCLEFFKSHSFEICYTQSNMESFEKMKEEQNSGAIVPTSVLKKETFPIVFEDVTDSKCNETRFFYLTLKESHSFLKEDLCASVVITSLEDRAGILFEILKQFNEYHFNLKGILSRPQKDQMGHYIFYIEFELKKKDVSRMQKLLKELNSSFLKIRLLGVYDAV